MTVDHDALSSNDIEQAGQVEGAGNESGTVDEGGDSETSSLDALNSFLDDGNDDANEPGSESGAKSEASGEGQAENAGSEGGEGEAGAKGKASQGDAESGDGKGAPAKEPDPINDPIPEDVKGKTRERMESVISTLKEREEQLQATKAERDDLVGMLTETGASADQIGRTLETLKLVNSRDPAVQKKGLALLREDVNRIAALVGEDVGDTQLLQRHPDLAEEVQSGDITEKRAREIALARESHKTRQQQDQLSAQQRDQQEKLKRETNAGLTQLDQLEASLKANDPDYLRKRAVIVPAVKGMIAQAAKVGSPIHPSQWAGLFKTAYDNLQLPAEQKPNGTNGSGQQPLRGRQPAGTGKQKPQTGLEVLEVALDDLDAR